MRLGEVIEEFSSRNRDSGCNNVSSVTNSQGFVSSTEYFDKEVFSKDLSTYKIVEPGMFAYNPSRINVGSVACYRGETPVIVSPLYVVFSIDRERIDCDYLDHYLHCSVANRYIRMLTAGSVRDSLKFSSLCKVELPLPPLPTQRVIAEELDRICELKRTAEKLVEKYRLLIKAKFSEMFGAGGYVDCELIDVTHFIDYRGKTPTKSLSGVPLITAKNVRKNGFSVEPREYIPEDMFERWMTRGFPVSGDVLFTTEAPLGFVCRIPNDYKRFAVGQRIVTMQPDAKRLDSVYLEEVLRSDDFQRKLIQKSSGSTVTGIRSKLLEKLTIPLPPIALQQQFAAFVEKVEKLEQAAKETVEKYDLLYRSKLQEYFG